MKQIQATVLAAAVTLSILCLGAASPFGTSKQDLENRLSFIEQQNTQMRTQLDDLSRRVDILTARVNDMYTGQGMAPPSAGAVPAAPAGRPSYSAPSNVPNLEVVRISPDGNEPKRQPRGRVYVQKSSDSNGTVIEEATPSPLPGTNYVPPPDPADDPTPPAAPPAMAAPAAPQKPAVENSKDEKEAYNKIKELWDGGQKDSAAPLMEDYVRQFPRGAHLDEVAYKLGKYRFDAGNYSKAIESFRIVTDKFPGSSYGADAQYMIGECYLELGQEDKAGDAFREVLVLYPFSNAASKAEEKLGACCK